MPLITWEDAAGVLFVRSSNLGMEDIKSCPLLIGVFYFCLPDKILKLQFCFKGSRILQYFYYFSFHLYCIVRHFRESRENSHTSLFML